MEKAPGAISLAGRLLVLTALLGLILILAGVLSERQAPHDSPWEGASANPGLREILAPAAVPLPAASHACCNSAPTNESLDENPPIGAAAPVFDDFRSWVERFSSAPDKNRAELERSGESLAVKRREALQALIATDPERALQQALPKSSRPCLPESVQAHLEECVSGRGDFQVLASLGEREGQVLPIQRWVELGGRRFEAHVYGRRISQTSKQQIPLHGIALAGHMAVHESPIRVLASGEKPDARLAVGNPDARCPVSGVISREVAVEVGDVVYYLCSGGHIKRFEQQWIAKEGRIAYSGGESQGGRSPGSEEDPLLGAALAAAHPGGASRSDGRS